MLLKRPLHISMHRLIVKIEYRKNFIKQYSKLNRKQQQAADKAVTCFVANPKTKRLRLHKLKGAYSETYSISAGGDLRLHFVVRSSSTDVAVFVAVGTRAII